MKKTNLISLSISAAALVAGASLIACGDDTTGPASPIPDASGDGTVVVGDTGTSDSTTPDGSTPDGSTPDGSAGDAGDGGDADAGPPPPPTLGAQIDRFGRPAINTALNHTFDTSAAKGPAKDAYNADSDAGAWGAEYTPQFALNLAIYDSLDTGGFTDGGGGCGNQFLAQDDAGAARYHALAGVLANDKMWIYTGSTTCTQYLGVELVATGAIPPNPDGGAVDQCGGRTLGEDVIDETYSVVASGMLSGVSDGIGAVASKTDGTAFPYLSDPQ